MLTGKVEKQCQRHTTGGKGNRGKFTERDPHVCAAGLPTAQAENSVEAALQQYLLKDEVDSLISDAIIPPLSRPRTFPPVRHPVKLDQRHCGTNSELSNLVNPPNETKFANLVSSLKDTIYKSFWKTPLGKVPDPVPMLPDGYDVVNTAHGVSTDGFAEGRLYNLVMPKEPLPDMTPPSKLAAAQTCRNYCRPSFDPKLTYGYRTNVDKRGVYAKCCLTDDRVVDGTGDITNVNYIQADLQKTWKPLMGRSLTPYNIIKCVPAGHSFGKEPPEHENMSEVLSPCKVNPKVLHFRKCLAHLNSLRKILSKCFLTTFFKNFYLDLKYYDKDKSGWVPKQIVYDNCSTRLIRFDPSLIEFLLVMWKAFDGSNIEYKTFVHVLNFTQPLPELPKVPDFSPEYLDYRTTYGEMVKPGQEVDERLRAGHPSGRYLDLNYPITYDRYCRAHRIHLPDESDMYTNLTPSILSLLGVNHRDMFAKREPAMVKKVFEAAGEKLSDERFNEVWEEAKKHHSLGWVCYETFRRALEQIQVPPKENKNGD